MPWTLYSSTAGWPEESSYDCRVVPPGRLAVELGACGMPQTFVHWSRDSVALAGFTTASEVPYQIATRGHGPEYPGSAPRTRLPHCAGVLLVALYWQVSPLDRSVAQAYGMPPMM